MSRRVLPLLVAVAFAAAPAAASAASLYVAPVAHGSGDCHDEADACTLSTAFADAQNDDVFVRGDQGAYDLTSALNNTHSPISVHGYRGRPRINFSGGGLYGLAFNDVTANNLYVSTGGATTALYLVGSTVDNVIVKTTSTAQACYVSNTTLTNSVCWAGSHGGLAIETAGSDTLRNDTFFGGAEAAVKSLGRTSDCFPCTSSTVNLVNVIARPAAGGAGLKAESDNTADITVSSRYSNYPSTLKSGTTAKDHINRSATDQARAPLFVNAGAGNFHEAPGSPTIDKGVNEAANGTADFDGDARTLNGATDIGADECVTSCFAPAGGSGLLITAAVNGFKASPKSFFAASSGPTVKASRKQRKRKTGTKVSLRLNEAASLLFKVQRRQKGRRVRRRGKRVCVKPTRKNHRKRRCTRYVTLRGGFTFNGATRANSFHFTGRLRSRKLKPGRYRLLATPTAHGKRGRTVRSSFKIKRPPRKRRK